MFTFYKRILEKENEFSGVTIYWNLFPTYPCVEVMCSRSENIKQFATLDIMGPFVAVYDRPLIESVMRSGFQFIYKNLVVHAEKIFFLITGIWETVIIRIR